LILLVSRGKKSGGGGEFGQIRRENGLIQRGTGRLIIVEGGGREGEKDEIHIFFTQRLRNKNKEIACLDVREEKKKKTSRRGL